jgi:hypothetical protein
MKKCTQPYTLFESILKRKMPRKYKKKVKKEAEKMVINFLNSNGVGYIGY